jgi:hypothetical protein
MQPFAGERMLVLRLAQLQPTSRFRGDYDDNDHFIHHFCTMTYDRNAPDQCNYARDPRIFE